MPCCRYRIDVVTSDVRGAGTDAAISLELSGHAGTPAGPWVLDRQGAFGRGQVSTVLTAWGHIDVCPRHFPSPWILDLWLSSFSLATKHLLWQRHSIRLGALRFALRLLRLREGDHQHCDSSACLDCRWTVSLLPVWLCKALQGWRSPWVSPQTASCSTAGTLITLSSLCWTGARTAPRAGRTTLWQTGVTTAPGTRHVMSQTIWPCCRLRSYQPGQCVCCSSVWYSSDDSTLPMSVVGHSWMP